MQPGPQGKALGRPLLESQACGGGSQHVPVGRAEACRHRPLCCELREVLLSFVHTLLGIHVLCSQLLFQLPQPPAGQPSLPYLTPPLSHGPRPCLVPRGLDCSVSWELANSGHACGPRRWGPLSAPLWRGLEDPRSAIPLGFILPAQAASGGGGSRPTACWTCALEGPASP